MLCSIVMPVFNEEAGIMEAYSRLSEAMERVPADWELVCVDDGSTDGTYELLRDLAQRDARVKVIRFSRNFGVPAAHSAGLRMTSGDVAFMVSADLQEPIDMLPVFLEKWQEGYKVVWGVKETLRAPVFTKLLSKAYHWIFRRLGGLPQLPSNIGFYLIDRQVIQTLMLFPERNRSLAGLLAWMGFPQTQVRCHFGARRYGESKWTFAKKVKVAIDMFAAFSYVPIRLTSLLGFALSALSFAYGVLIIVLAMTRRVSVPGWSTLMVAILFLGGVQLVVIGMLGEYIWRALDESRQRPPYIVSEAIGFSEAEVARLGVPAESGGTPDLQDCLGDEKNARQ